MFRPIRLYRYHALSLWNWRSSYLSRFIEPIAYFAFLAAGLGGVLHDVVGGYASFALTGMICFLAFRSATATVGDVANDRKWGVFAIYTLQGGTAAGYLLSILLFALSVFAAQLVVLFGLALAIFGGGVRIDELAVEAAIGLLIVCGWIGFGAAVGAKVQSYSKRDMIIVLTSLPVVLSAPLFFPLDTAPAYLRALSRLNPLSYQVGWLRDIGIMSISLAAAWAVVGLGIGCLLLSRADRLSRER